MGVSIGGAKKKFADIVDELHTEPPMMSQFAVWLDLKLAEYKLQGDMRIDFHECVSAPDWMKGSKCQCLERAQYGLSNLNGKNQWMYSDAEGMMEKGKLGRNPSTISRHEDGELDKEDFEPSHLSMEEFGELDESGKTGPDTTIDSQHPLVQLIRRKSRKKTVGSGKRGRPKGGSKEGTLTESGVRVKRVKAKRKEPDSFPDSTIPAPPERFPSPVAVASTSQSAVMPDQAMAPPPHKPESGTEPAKQGPSALQVSSAPVVSSAQQAGPGLQMSPAHPTSHLVTAPHVGTGQHMSTVAHMGTGHTGTQQIGKGQHMGTASQTGKGQNMGTALHVGGAQHMGTASQVGAGQQKATGPHVGAGHHMGTALQVSTGQQMGAGQHMVTGPHQGTGPRLSTTQHMSMPPNMNTSTLAITAPPNEFKGQPPDEDDDDIPDLSDEDFLDEFNDDLDDCSFGSMTPPDSPEHMDEGHAEPGHHPGPGIPTSAPNVRQSFSKSQDMMADSAAAHFRPGLSQEKGTLQANPAFFRAAYPAQSERVSSPSHSNVATPVQQHISSPQTSLPHSASHAAPCHTATSHHMPTSMPSFQAGHNIGQSSQSSGNPGLSLRFDPNRTNLTAPQSLLRGSMSDSSNEAHKIGMDFGRDPFNEDFYDDDFGTATDEEDIIALESDEEAAHLAMLERDLDSPSASLPEQLAGARTTLPAQPVSDPENPTHQEGVARKKRKYTRKDDGIKVPKDVRLAVHNVVKDLKSQEQSLEWDYTSGLMNEWNREMNSKIVALVENRMGEVNVDICMKAINCYYVSRRAQWRKQQNNPGDDSKKKVKQQKARTEATSEPSPSHGSQ